MPFLASRPVQLAIPLASGAGSVTLVDAFFEFGLAFASGVGCWTGLIAALAAVWAGGVAEDCTTGWVGAGVTVGTVPAADWRSIRSSRSPRRARLAINSR